MSGVSGYSRDKCIKRGYTIQSLTGNGSDCMTTNANGNDNVQPESTGQPEIGSSESDSLHIELDEFRAICNTDCI